VEEFDNPGSTFFGSVTLEQDGPSQVINSGPCPGEATGGQSNTLAFVAQIAEGVDRVRGLGFSWTTRNPNPAGVGLQGFYLTYDS